ncbi:bile acid:sodium symporter family protein [Cognaticolwellia mytili]|uniref:bile acid:sodium symporter family protein n=1 Tax=Cognaticolwellia mytili TaxID=1888913 RepID=UPI000A1716E1|nr:bile acid:sodium symporter [Cognaticolwellia mytili]
MQEVISQVLLPVVLAAIMLAMGLSLSLNDFKRVFLHPKVTLLGLILQLVLLPAIALIIAYSLSLSPIASSGLLLLALCPGGATSNLFSYLAKGNVALSVTLTAITSIFIPFSLPIIFSIYVEFLGRDQQVFVLPLVIVIKKLFVVTVMPILAGMLLRYRFKKTVLNYEKIIKRVAAGTMLTIVILLLLTNMKVVLEMATVNGIAVLSLCCFSLLITYGISTMILTSAKDIKTIAIEVGVQNAGTAMMVAFTIINQPQLAVIPLMYGLLMNIPVFIFVWWVQRK